ncbi:MAG: dihydrofolate reductase [Chitinophagaceae bacterium]|nr:dihydrofolate reductase [Chitinophagaceae bacterium]
MIITLVVAAAENNAIGKNNELLWHLPNDLKFFKNTTWGLPVIMGRKTFGALNNKPLPGRTNIVISRQSEFKADAVTVVKSLDEAIDAAAATDAKEICVIGGGEIYRQAMEKADKIIITRVHAILEGDTYFPEIAEKDWVLISNKDFPADEKHKYAYSFQVWSKSN